MKLNPSMMNPLPGRIYGHAILGQYETASGILVVKDMKRNPKVETMVVTAIGGPFTIHGGRRCRICKEGCTKKERPGTYWCKPGDTVWMFRGTFKKHPVDGIPYGFIRNEDVVAVLQND